jgi:hypothetical protein
LAAVRTISGFALAPPFIMLGKTKMFMGFKWPQSRVLGIGIKRLF